MQCVISKLFFPFSENTVHFQKKNKIEFHPLYPKIYFDYFQSVEKDLVHG